MIRRCRPFQSSCANVFLRSASVLVTDVPSESCRQPGQSMPRPFGPGTAPGQSTEPESGWSAYTTFAPPGLSHVMVTVLFVVPVAVIS